MIEVPLTQGKVALIDNYDWDVVIQHTWHATKKQTSGIWYALTNIWFPDEKRGKTLGMHSMIMCACPGEKIDHRDSDGLNNRRDNLRLCTHAQNQYNQRSMYGTSKFKGVSWFSARGKWVASIGWQYRHFTIGYFDSELDAAMAYNEAAAELFGEFARLNTVMQ